MTFKFIDVQQNTDEWFALRGGKLTSSKLGTIMANYGKAFGEPAKKYAVQVAVEQITGNPISSGYQNEHMARGHEQEPMARMIYEDENFVDVTNGGFFESEFIGCSPDGIVDNDGVIEIKSVIAPVHFASVKRQNVDPAYKWQLVGNLKFTGRDWIDFVSYCESFPVDKQLFTHRLYAKDLEEDFSKLDIRVSEFLLLVAETKEIILNNGYTNV